MILYEEYFSNSILKTPNEKILWKLTALWGFSEAALGGFLHALKLPFTGLLVGGSAVIIITLIAFFSDKRGSIIRATIIVLIIKGMVSPHTPVTAYLAVFLQGLLGEVFFFSKKMFRTSALFFAVTVMLFSASQKLIIITIVFGQTLWTALDEFAKVIFSQFLSDQSQPINFSLSFFLIALYSGIYILGGIIIGILAGKLPLKIISIHYERQLPGNTQMEMNNHTDSSPLSKPKRVWWKKKSGIAYIVFSISFITLSFMFPEFGKGKSSGIILMFLRSIIVISLWYFLFSPLILRVVNKLLKNKRSVYAGELLGMIESFPQFRSIVKTCWKNSSGSNYFKRVNLFLMQVFSDVLLSDFSNTEKLFIPASDSKNQKK